MRNYTIEKVLKFLETKNIRAVKQDRVVKIGRDEICEKIESKGEECYEILLKFLNELDKEFSYRFYYSMKDDDYLWLDTICGE